MAISRYKAGSDDDLRHNIRLNHIQAGMVYPRSSLLARFVEFWCQSNAEGRWRVEETSRDVDVWFDDDRDMVLFRISEEGSYFEGPFVSSS